MQRVLPLAPTPGAQAPEAAEAVTTAVHARAGSLFVLTGGGSVANPPALLGQEATADLLRSLAEEFDYVLIDAPSPLEFSDVIPLLDVVGRDRDRRQGWAHARGVRSASAPAARSALLCTGARSGGEPRRSL